MKTFKIIYAFAFLLFFASCSNENGMELMDDSELTKQELLDRNCTTCDILIEDPETGGGGSGGSTNNCGTCLLYTSDAADD